MCPLFLPASLLPLSSLFSGECAENSGIPIPQATLRECCNRGYAREACPRAAAIAEDAVRFLIKSDCNGSIEVAWAVERNHHPVSVGVETVAAACGPVAAPLARQAHAVAADYRRRKGLA